MAPEHPGMLRPLRGRPFVGPLTQEFLKKNQIKSQKHKDNKVKSGSYKLTNLSRLHFSNIANEGSKKSAWNIFLLYHLNVDIDGKIWVRMWIHLQNDWTSSDLSN